jgi:hypothetical protein
MTDCRGIKPVLLELRANDSHREWTLEDTIQTLCQKHHFEKESTLFFFAYIGVSDRSRCGNLTLCSANEFVDWDRVRGKRLTENPAGCEHEQLCAA